MKTIIALTALLAGAAVTLAVNTAHAEINENISPVTRNAVLALYVAGDDAQRAIVEDVCEHDEIGIFDTYAARDALTDVEAIRQYNLVRDALHVAYATVPQGDESLEAVRRDYCAHAGER